MIIPRTALTMLHGEGKMRHAIVQEKPEYDPDQEFQRQCRRNARGTLTIALQQLCELSLAMGCKTHNPPPIIALSWDHHSSPLLEAFFRRFSSFSEDLTIRHPIRKQFVAISFKLLSLSSPLQYAIIKKVLPRIVGDNILATAKDLLKEQQEIEKRRAYAEKYYLSHNTYSRYLTPLHTEDLFKNSSLTDKQLLDIQHVLNKIQAHIIPHALKNYEFASDKRRFFMEAKEEQFAKIGNILLLLVANKIIPSFYPTEQGYEIYG